MTNKTNWYVNVGTEHVGRNHPVIKYLNETYKWNYRGTLQFYGVNKDNDLNSSPYKDKFTDQGCTELTLDEFKRTILGQNDDMFPIY
jgi:hypothetical protein